MKPQFSRYLVCFACGGELKDGVGVSKCTCCGKVYKTKRHIFVVDEKLDMDIEMSKNRWDEFYVRFKDQYLIDEKKTVGFQELINRDIDLSKLNKKSVFLEIGCGPFLQGRLMAKKCQMVIGVDYSKNALRLAEEMFRREGRTNYLLIQSDIVHLPLKNNSVDFSYGGGVVEHIEEIEKCIKELARVVKKGGTSYNSVPIVNIGSLTYRQIWGNIPDIPVLKHVYKFMHFKVLKTKMHFGYERSYRVNTFKKWHYQAGFSQVEVKRMPMEPELFFLPKSLRGFFLNLAKNSILFWPMACFIATK